jgi:hypothetical protein
MTQPHRVVTRRVARMLRELEGTDTAHNHAADIAKPATNPGAHTRKRAAQQWFKAAAAGFVPLSHCSRMRSI